MPARFLITTEAPPSTHPPPREGRRGGAERAGRESEREREENTRSQNLGEKKNKRVPTGFLGIVFVVEKGTSLKE